ncbi:TetR/AcrR family transcriptional regulator [Microbacterium sp. NEAU-LLC]|uniref:TetR/AcrR family transcriptional regulator n=1 Tax=Microbacterium helvum TaxID=2773713 RepID=A0ABR8NRC3_9MICO|nr:TetR family transcriptional regulator [Microbacterium helvum]MBD3943197.1 TetR/AcrR family transcriptional regulator [Microbacterium helvum]
MPKVSEEYREARRDEIARAAVRVLERKGVRETSIADIVDESGLSTGAIYSHFTNKAELARYIVERFLFPRIDELEATATRGIVLRPRDVLERMLGTIRDTGLSPALVVQFWGEALGDDAMHAQLVDTAGHLLGALTAALTPWARERTTTADGTAALAAATARTVASLAQGYIANTAVFGPRTVDEYVASLREAVET